jgi:hypothetical protein
MLLARSVPSTAPPTTKQLAVGLAVSVLIDATVIRAVLLPSVMALLGDRNWYLPRWLAGFTAGGAGRRPPADPPSPVGPSLPAGPHPEPAEPATGGHPWIRSSS